MLPRKRRSALLFAAFMALAFVAAACGNEGDSDADGEDGLTGTIRADGSSTVAPLTEAAAERFQEENPGVRVTVGTSGTSGGFEKFCNGETDISDASRPIKEEEVAACAEEGVEYDNVQVANDALSAVVHPDNPLECISVEALKQAWDLDTNVDSWGDIEGLDTELPDEELTLFGPGSDSGTYDYWTEAINGEEGRIRTDYNSIGEDDEAAVNGISADPWAMAYIPYSFVTEAGDRVKALEIKNPETGECVAPTLENVQSGAYAPLGRPLFIYPSAEALERPEVVAFIEFFIESQEDITQAASYIPMNADQVAEAQAKVAALATS
ncbi:MAG: PstS family phosphate ABC transporter substrate-binding protein [Actinomycetota bacterium]